VALDALEASYLLMRQLREPLRHLRAKDRRLYNQLRTAATSIALNLAEGEARTGQDRLHLWKIALGSAKETRSALRVAEGFGDVPFPILQPAFETLDRVIAMLWRMTR